MNWIEKYQLGNNLKWLDESKNPPSVNPPRGAVQQAMINIAGSWENNKPQFLKDIPLLDLVIGPTLDYVSGRSDVPVMPIGTIGKTVAAASKDTKLVGAINNLLESSGKLSSDNLAIKAKSLKVEKGRQWLDEWVNHPETKEKIKQFSKEYPVGKDFYKKKLNPVEFNDKIIDDIAIRQGKADTKHRLMGVSISDQFSGKGNIYLRTTIPLNKVESVAIHELTHDLTNGKFPYKATLKHQKPMDMAPVDPVTREINTNFLNKDQKFNNYLKSPTETYARLMQTRRFFDLKPGQVVSEDHAKVMLNPKYNIFSGVNPEWFDTFKSSKDFADILNKLPLIGGAALINKDN